MHVLIIEDEALIAMDLQWLVEQSGATSTEIVDSERSAIDSAAAHKPDVITSDVTLKTGSGPSAIKAIKAAMGSVPVIYVTSTPQACGDLAPDERVLPKPINEVAFKHMFEELRAASR